MSVTKTNLRVEFVEMLFALAIGQVAIEFSEAISQRIFFKEHPYVFSHLMLGAFITILSWIGWQNSKSRGTRSDIDSIFSIPFLILLVDILLVIFYFIIVRSSDFKVIEGKLEIKGEMNHETLLSIGIFIIYIIWDLLTKGFETFFKTQDNLNFTMTLKFKGKDFMERTWPGVICLFICSLFYFSFKDYVLSSWKIFIVDICLILVFILFRGLKPDLKKKDILDSTIVPAKFYTTVPSTSIKINVTDNLFWIKRFLGMVLPIIGIIVGYILVLVL